MLPALRDAYLSQRASLTCRLGIHSTTVRPGADVIGDGPGRRRSLGMIAAAGLEARKASNGANGFRP